MLEEKSSEKCKYTYTLVPPSPSPPNVKSPEGELLGVLRGESIYFQIVLSCTISLNNTEIIKSLTHPILEVCGQDIYITPWRGRCSIH